MLPSCTVIIVPMSHPHIEMKWLTHKQSSSHQWDGQYTSKLLGHEGLTCCAGTSRSKWPTHAQRTTTMRRLRILPVVLIFPRLLPVV